jgi:hypothetical protein
MVDGPLTTNLPCKPIKELGALGVYLRHPAKLYSAPRSAWEKNTEHLHQYTPVQELELLLRGIC